MAHHKICNSAAALGAALFLSACGKAELQPTLLDAAALFNENEGLFQSIRAAYPGPYEDFTRIPARNPADASKLDTDLLEVLRNDVPVEFIDFFPIGDTGKDEIDVVLWRYQSGDHWNTISLIYFSMPMTLADGLENMSAFDECGEDALRWLEENKQAGDISAFCRIDSHWQAFQRIE